MRTAITALGLLAAAAAAPAHAQQADAAGQSPLWTRVLETASPYVSAANDAVGGASSAIEGSEALKVSRVSREVGNRAARKAAADTYNAARASGQGMVKAIERFNLGILTSVADIGGTLTGLAVEGDYRAMPGVVVDTGVKGTVTAGGAWALAGTGAALGSAFGPLGTVVGGAVGGALGAVGGSWGYDATNEALQRNGYQSVRSYVDSLFAEEELTPLERLVRANRRAEELRAQDERNAEVRKQYEEQARALGLGTGGDREVELVTPRTLDAAIPVIPVDCTIDVVMWTKASPAIKWHGTFRVDGDNVTGRGEIHAVRGQGQSAAVWVDEFTGTRRENVFTGKNRGTLRQVRDQGQTSDGVCVTDWWSSNTSDEEWTFRLGGTGSVNAQGTGTSTYKYSGACSSMGTVTQRYAIAIRDEETSFTWKIR